MTSSTGFSERKPYFAERVELALLGKVFFKIKIIIPEGKAMVKAINKGEKEFPFGICSPMAAKFFS